MNNYLIEGISGTGKTEICNELKKRGYETIEADEMFGYYGDSKTWEPTENKSQLNWLWNKNRVDEGLNKDSIEPIFVCGGAMNQNEFGHYFKKTFTLQIDDDTLKNRLLTRTNNDFGKCSEDLARQLEWNKGVVEYSRQRGTILIDATKPAIDVADEILGHVFGTK